MNKNVICGIICCTSPCLFAGSTGFASVDDDIYLSNGTTYAFGSVVILGTFTTPPTSTTTYANSVGNFTELSRVTITNSGGFPTYSGSYTTSAADAGKQVYQWLLNTNPTTTTPTQQALFTSPTWTLTGGSGADVKQLKLNTGTPVLGTKTVVSNIPRITLANITVAPISTWRSGQFTSLELNNPALQATVWGDNADPDGDGIRNFLEFAFGTQAKVSNGPSRLPTSTVSAGALKMSYKRPTGGVSGVTYAVEYKNNVELVTGDTGWTPAVLNTHYTQTITPNGDGTETVGITFSTPVSGKAFARIAITY